MFFLGAPKKPIINEPLPIFITCGVWHVCHLRKIEQFQQIIDSNDQSVARLREQLRRLEPERERLSELVQQRQEPQWASENSKKLEPFKRGDIG